MKRLIAMPVRLKEPIYTLSSVDENRVDELVRSRIVDGSNLTFETLIENGGLVNLPLEPEQLVNMPFEPNAYGDFDGDGNFVEKYENMDAVYEATSYDDKQAFFKNGQLFSVRKDSPDVVRRIANWQVGDFKIYKSFTYERVLIGVSDVSSRKNKASVEFRFYSIDFGNDAENQSLKDEQKELIDAYNKAKKQSETGWNEDVHKASENYEKFLKSNGVLLKTEVEVDFLLNLTRIWEV